jgi:hypothetical protein
MDDIQNEIINLGWGLYIIEDCKHCSTQLDDIPNFKHYILFSKIGALLYKPEYVQSILNIENIYSFPLWYNATTKKKIYGVIDINILIDKQQENQ